MRAQPLPRALSAPLRLRAHFNIALCLILALTAEARAFVEVAASYEPETAVTAPAPAPLYDGGGTERPEPRLAVDRDEPISLAANRVSVILRDQIAVVRVTHVFQNNTARVLQARYVMPLGAGAHVTGYAIWEKGRRLEGELMDVHRAESLYRAVTSQDLTARPEVAQEVHAVRRPRDPGILRQMGQERFETHIYPIEPYALKQMELSYSQRVTAADGACRWDFPLAAAAVFQNDPGELAFQIELQDSAGLDAVDCDFSGAQIERRPGGRIVTVQAAARGHRPAGPFTLRWRTGLRPLTPAVLYHRAAGESAYALLRLALPADARATAPGLSVVVAADCSRSLGGEKGRRQAETLRALTADLDPADRVQWLRFAADGDTRLIPALRSAFAAARAQAEGRTPVVVLYSDGVTLEDPDEVLTDLSPGPVRLLVLGSGHDDDTELLSRLAERHGGWLWVEGQGERRERWSPRRADILEQPYGTALVQTGSGPPPRQLLERLRAPAATALRLEASDGRRIEIQPPVHPPVPAGGTAGFLLRLDGTGQRHLRLRGQLQDQVLDIPVDLDPPAAEPPHRFLAAYFAKGEAEELLRQYPQGDADPGRARIVELSLAHRFVTPYTAFLSLPDAERKRLLLGPAPAGDADLYRFAAATPEPGIWALLALGALVLWAATRRHAARPEAV